MRTIFKWGGRLLGLAVVLAIGAAALLYAAIASSVPSDNGSASIAGLDETVQVTRDENWVGHIEAQSQSDALTALGFIHAQDRFWQMHVLRMVGQGRLSEMFGQPTVDTDIFLRTLGIATASQASVDVLQPKTRAMLEAYANGVNHWLERNTGLMEAKLPPEFTVLGVDAEPWQPWHSVAILKVMALTLDSNMGREINRLVLASKGFNPGEINELLPYGPRDNPPPLPDLRTLYGFEATDNARAVEPGQEETRQAFDLSWPIGVTASNNWAVAGSRSDTGKPLLANDPHLGLAAPSVFYLTRLAFPHEGERMVIAGGSLPGTPLVLVGRNNWLAWGLTTTNLDSQDIFIERVKPDDATLYQTPFGWRAFETETMEIAVSGAEPVTFERRTTRHGPVLPAKFRGLDDVLPAGHVAALSWGSGAADDTTMDAAMAFALTRNVSDFQEAMRRLVAPMQSIVAADVDGNIGLISPARVPVRAPENRIAGRAPVPGWLSEYDWQGSVPFEQLPRIVNPPNGAIATANANWMPQGYDRHITFDWDEHFRQGRVEDRVVGANAPHTLQTMRDIQGDTYSPGLVEFRDAAFAQLEQGAGQDTAMLAALRAWDGEMLADRAEPLIMAAWWRHTQIGILEDDLGDDYHRFDKGHIRPVIDMLTVAGARDWCDNRTTQQTETCGVILANALSKTVEELRELQDTQDWRKWRWGAAHIAFGEHRPFSSVAPLSRFFTVETESAGGSYTLLRGRTDYGEKTPYRSVHASAMRAVYDLADLDRSEFIISTGQSGHFASPHYRDMAQPWADMQYVTIPTSASVLEGQSKGKWVLHPGQGNQ